MRTRRRRGRKKVAHGRAGVNRRRRAGQAAPASRCGIEPEEADFEAEMIPVGKLGRAILLAMATAGLALSAAAQQPAREEKTDPPAAEGVLLRIEVTGGKKNTPVESASVYVRYPEDGVSIRKKLVEMNLKTNAEGATRVPVRLPRGKVLIQVVASGWKTFGRWYDIEKPEETIKIKLEEPPRWY